MDHSHDQYDAGYYERLPAGGRKEIDPPADEFYATDVFSDYAMEFIRQGQRSGGPWMLYLSHSSPHFPLQAPKELVDSYYEMYLAGWDVLREQRFERMVASGLVDPESWKLSERSMVPVDDDAVANGYQGRQNPAWDSLPEDRRRDLARRMAIFAAMVERVDDGVGRIINHLKATGDFDNTLIMLTSDNGACYEWGPFGFDESSRKGVTHLHTGADPDRMGGRGTYHSYGSAWANLGNTPFRMYKHFTHEGGVCAPLIAHWPARVAAGGAGSRNGLVRGRTHIVDIVPTLRDAAGAAYPTERAGYAIPGEEGISLFPAMTGTPLPQRTIFFSHQQARAVIRGDWKIVWGKRTSTPLAWELYNLAVDRTELNDLAGEHPDIVADLAAEWEAYRVRVGLDEFEPWDVPEREGIAD